MRLSSLLAAALVGALLPMTASAAAPPDDACPSVVAATSVVPGATGTGYTVASGTTRETFSVEVLGVLEGALAPGRDLIVVELSGAVIDRVGGAWFGMSGSPVYLGDRLLGSVSYLMSGSSTVAGVTPATDMVALLDIASDATPIAPPTVTLDVESAARVALATGTSTAEAARQRLTAMPIPLGVSGLADGRLDRMQAALSDRGLSVIAHRASASAVATAATPAPMRPGDNLAAVLSYGDVSVWGAGTVTYVCGSSVLAFGHPMLYSGPSTLGLGTATSLALVPDPVWGSFELVAPGGIVGTVDQDRLAGLRGVQGTVPTTLPVTSTVRYADAGTTRSGRTDIVMRGWAADLAFSHALSNLDIARDRGMAGGTASIDTTVRGRTESGRSFSYRRGNVFASDMDITMESLLEFYADVALVQDNGLEPVRLTGIDVQASVRDRVEREEIVDVAYSTDGTSFVSLAGEPELYLPGGGRLWLRVTLDPGSGPDETVDLVLDIPRLTGPAALEVRGGTGQMVDPWQCMYDPESCLPDASVTDVEGLLAWLSSRPRNDDLVAALSVWEEDGSGPSSGDGGVGVRPVAETHLRRDRVVSGFVGIPVFLDAGAAGPTVERLAGADRISTAVAVSRSGFPGPGSADTVVIARADDFADALAGGPLAATLGLPLLLTWGDRLPTETAAEIERLGITSAVVLGGDAAVAPAVLDELTRSGIETIDRISGVDRYDTARLVAERIGGAVVVLARGTGTFADAVSASGLAAVEGVPLLLTERDTVPPATLAALRDLGVAGVRIVGGEAAVSPAVAGTLEATGIAVERLAGPDRYATSVAVAAAAEGGGAGPDIHLATGRDFPDALVAGASAGARGAILLLVDGQDPAGNSAAREHLMRLAGSSFRLVVVGGEAAVSSAVIDDLWTVLAPAPPSAPEDPVVE